MQSQKFRTTTERERTGFETRRTGMYNSANYNTERHVVDKENTNVGNKLRKLFNWSDEQTCGKVVITKEIATEMLKYNKHNRKIIKNAVDRYSKSIVDGSFSLSNDMITFNKDGELTNGQHRLMAIQKADTPLEAYVAIDIEQTSEMDRGQKRNIIDNIIITGNIDEKLRNANVIKSCKCLLDHKHSFHVFTSKYLEDFINNNAVAIEIAYNNDLLVLQGSTKYVFNANIAAAFLAATIYYYDKYYKNSCDTFENLLNDLVHIRKVLTSGVTITESDALIIKLRDKIKDGSSGSSQLKREAIFRGTQSCIDSICSKNNRKTITFTKDIFI